MFAISGLGDHAVSGRMVCAVALADLDSLMGVVFCQAAGPHRGLYLDTRHATPPAHGSIDEFCLEVYVADGAGGGGVSGSMAISTSRGATRWLLTTLLLVAAYVWLARGVESREKIVKRTYRFAE